MSHKVLLTSRGECFDVFELLDGLLTAVGNEGCDSIKQAVDARDARWLSYSSLQFNISVAQIK